MKLKEFRRFKWLACHVQDISQQHSDEKPIYVAQAWDGPMILCWPVGWRTRNSFRGTRWIHYSNLKVSWPTQLTLQR